MRTLVAMVAASVVALCACRASVRAAPLVTVAAAAAVASTARPAPPPPERSIWWFDAEQTHRARPVGVVPLPDGALRVIGAFDGAGPLAAGVLDGAQPLVGVAGATTVFCLDLAPGGRVRASRRIGSFRSGSASALGDIAVAAAPDGAFAVAVSTAGEADFASADLGGDLRPGLVVAAFATDGTARWARRVGGPMQAWSVRVGRGPDGQLAVASQYLRANRDTQDESDPLGTFVAALAPDGALRWDRSLCTGLAQTVGEGPSDVVFDDDGGVVVAGVASASRYPEECGGGRAAQPPRTRLPGGLYAQKLARDGAPVWYFTDASTPHAMAPRLAVGLQSELVLAWSHARLDGTGGIGGAVVVRLDGAAGRVQWRAHTPHAARALVLANGCVGIAGLFETYELGVTWLDRAGRQLRAARFGGMLRWSGATAVFTARNALAVFGVVTDCGTYDNSLVLGPAAQCAQTEPVFVARLVVPGPV